MNPIRQINVFVTTTIAEENLQRIRDVGSEVKLTSVAALFRGERHGEAEAIKKLAVILPGAEVIFGLRYPENIIKRAPNLKWIQVMLAGVDGYLDPELKASEVTLTRTAGIQAIAMSEVIICRMLMFAKRSPSYFQLKQEKKWERLESSILRNRTLGIVGYGNVGKELARLAKAFRMKVIATRKSARKDSRARYVDVMMPQDQLPRLLSESDYVALALPLTPQTNHLIGESQLKLMKKTSYLINISRGQIINEAALVKAIKEKWINGAALDVYEVEPLPETSELWNLPNIIFSPHVAASMEEYPELATELFCENLIRYINGKKLLKKKKKKQGY
ncbi:MAG: D-2-hydroxyacid dehydrogenase [Chloroflexi bacterium]|nr:D-2-hydroxyacid dehydrogenase [Chloroflexota bacterium]